MRYLALCFLVGCGADAAMLDLAQDTDARLDDTAGTTRRNVTLHFTADWQVTSELPLEKGDHVTVDYAASRLPGCQSDDMNAWAITGHARLPSGAVVSFPAAGHFPAPNITSSFDADEAGDVQLWFESTNRWGCQAWDSDYGRNYQVRVEPHPTIHFGADWSVRSDGLLGRGGVLTLDYALERLPDCRAGYSGLPTWEILAFYRFDDGSVASLPVTRVNGMERIPGPADIIVPAGAHQLEVWFKNSDRAGCVAWDSRFGENYRFGVN